MDDNSIEIKRIDTIGTVVFKFLDILKKMIIPVFLYNTAKLLLIADIERAKAAIELYNTFIAINTNKLFIIVIIFLSILLTIAVFVIIVSYKEIRELKEDKVF